MAAAHRTTWTNSTPSLDLDIVTSTTAGDTLVAWGVTDEGGSVFTWPSGFIEQANLRTTFDGQTLGAAIKKNATGSEGTLRITSNSGTLIGGVSGFSGVDTATQPDVASTTGNTNTGQASPWTIDAGSITPATAGAAIAAVMGSDSSPSGDAVHTFDGGGLSWTVHGDINSGFRNAAIASGIQSSAAAITVTGTGTQASANAARGICVIALRPAAGGAGGIVRQMTQHYYGGQS